MAAEKSAPSCPAGAPLVEQPPPDLSPWWRAHLDPLAAHAGEVLDVIAGTTLLH